MIKYQLFYIYIHVKRCILLRVCESYRDARVFVKFYSDRLIFSSCSNLPWIACPNDFVTHDGARIASLFHTWHTFSVHRHLYIYTCRACDNVKVSLVHLQTFMPDWLNTARKSQLQRKYNILRVQHMILFRPSRFNLHLIFLTKLFKIS